MRSHEGVEGTDGLAPLLAEQVVVVGMGADPEPHEVVRGLDGQGAILAPNPGRPEAPNLLEMERRVTWVLLEARVRCVRELLDLLRQGPVACPEIRGRMVGQRGVVFPAA